VVCYTENLNGIENIKAANKICHDNKVGFILSETLGLLGYSFVDFGEEHLVFDHDGEPTKSFIVSTISNDEKALVRVHEDKRHSYQEGDYVKFVEVEGMTEVNNI
jgi:ubiquitin-activating enzyme E1